MRFSWENRGELTLDEIGSLADAYPKFGKRAFASGLKSEGFRVKNEMQRYIATEMTPPLNPHTGILRKVGKGKARVKNFVSRWHGKKGSKTRRRVYWSADGGRTSAARKPMLRLRSSVRYAYDGDDQAVSIGFLRNGRVSKSLPGYVRYNAAGFTTRITPKMRRMLFAMGFPVRKSTTVLKTRTRPIVDPVFRRTQQGSAARINKKVGANIVRYLAGKHVDP